MGVAAVLVNVICGLGPELRCGLRRLLGGVLRRVLGRMLRRWVCGGVGRS